MHHWFASGLRERDARDGDENGNGGDEYISTGDHARISAGNGIEVKRAKQGGIRGVSSKTDCWRKCPVIAKRLDCGCFSTAFNARQEGGTFGGFRPHESVAEGAAVQTRREVDGVRAPGNNPESFKDRISFLSTVFFGKIEPSK
jgi:hypothetical protein